MGAQSRVDRHDLARAGRVIRVRVDEREKPERAAAAAGREVAGRDASYADAYPDPVARRYAPRQPAARDVVAGAALDVATRSSGDGSARGDLHARVLSCLTGDRTPEGEGARSARRPPR